MPHRSCLLAVWTFDFEGSKVDRSIMKLKYYLTVHRRWAHRGPSVGPPRFFELFSSILNLRSQYYIFNLFGGSTFSEKMSENFLGPVECSFRMLQQINSIIVADQRIFMLFWTEISMMYSPTNACLSVCTCWELL